MEYIKYVHGYSEKEGLRLKDQAGILDDIIHNDSIFPEKSLVLEAGCGVGGSNAFHPAKSSVTADSDVHRTSPLVISGNHQSI